jgi:Domain of unknown function (DUF4419)
MPVTVFPAEHPARALGQYLQPVTSGDNLLQSACSDEWRRCQGVIQSSFDKASSDSIYKLENGFVWASIQAYNQHHHLRIRPEDVWFSIINQLSFYINAHAEELRPFFVDHQGQKELVVVDSSTLSTADIGALAVRMTLEIEKNVNDPDLRTWVSHPSAQSQTQT